MKKLIFAAVFLLVFPALVIAHPGRTAADGCHYCRTNCDKWGEEWDKRHCHGSRIEKFLPIKIQVDEEKGHKKVDQKQTPGWEYSIKVKKTSIRSEEKKEASDQ